MPSLSITKLPSISYLINRAINKRPYRESIFLDFGILALILTIILLAYTSTTYYTKYERRYYKLDLSTLVPTS